MSRANIIRRIVERDVGKLGVAAESVQQQDSELYQAACEHFGTWETALRYAGVAQRRNRSKPPPRPSRHIRRITLPQNAGPEAVINVLLAMCVQGYNLSARNNARRDRRLYDAARRCFGSWSQAVIAAGINLEKANLPSKPLRIPRSELLSQIHERHASGKSMVWKQVCLENRILALAAKNAFKSWYRALLAAGLSTPNATAKPGNSGE